MTNESVLRQLFGDNRAEWPISRFDELFVTPRYASKLESLRPCFLVGGRGTGKTTSLQSLKYDLSLERYQNNGDSFSDMPYLGIVLRINKNQVNAFQGSGRTDEQWSKLFTHYFNLLVCSHLVQLCKWVEEITGTGISSSGLVLTSVDLAVNECSDLDQLGSAIKTAISKLQVAINNPQATDNILLSIAETPIRTLTDALIDSIDKDDKTVFCCIDEYENLLNYQQAVINTYIKHASPPLSYKVGVRKYGLKNRQTLNGNDLLKTPDDFGEIEIAEEGFESFAVEVAEKRLQRAASIGINLPTRLKDFLTELSFQEEAELLGAKAVSDNVMSELKTNCPEMLPNFLNNDFSELYFLRYWAEQDNEDVCKIAASALDSERQWKTRYGNYKYASLFWLTSGKKGIGIRKYYCGQNTYLALASGNIRFFLELIDQAISNELAKRGAEFDKILLTLSAKSQTLAAKKVGERKLDQLEGLADNGVQLKRLVLAIGKVFFEFAKSPIGKTPEVTTFLLEGEANQVDKVRKILKDGAGHLAIQAFPRTKATTNSELRDDEYRLHPIFCAFFEMSHRKKRRTTFQAKDLIDATESKPSAAILKLMSGTGHSSIDDLPEQLALFSQFYAGDSADE